MKVTGTNIGSDNFVASVEDGDTFNLLNNTTGEIAFDTVLTFTDEKNLYSFTAKTDNSLTKTASVNGNTVNSIRLSLKNVVGTISSGDLVFRSFGGKPKGESIASVSSSAIFSTLLTLDTKVSLRKDENLIFTKKIPVGKEIKLKTNQVHGQVINLNFFNAFVFGNGVESNRIKDDFNTAFIDKGAIVSTTLDAEYKEEHKENGLIFSGIFNSTSGLNEINQFIQGLPITKDINPIYGSIQKLHVRETDLITFCEDKVLKILANKDALFNADGNVNLTASTNVLGQSIGYVGEYGISKNPESFSSHAFRIYFADKARGAVLRLSRDGLTLISEKGMSDFFGDNLAASSNIIGSYNEDKGSYNITLNDQTLSFDERVDGWTSFKSFIPEAGFSINNKYYTFKNGDLYSHDNTTRNTFYGTAYESSVNVLINDIPTSVKSFKTLNYEGSDSRKYTYSGTISSTTIGAGTTLEVLEKAGYTPTQISTLTEAETKGWYANSITTDQQTGSVRFFKEKENFKFNKILGDTTTSSNIDTKELSVQGLGVPASISTSGTDKFSITVSIAIGGTHNVTLPSNTVLSRSAGSIDEDVRMIITPNDGFEITTSTFSFSSVSPSDALDSANATFDADPSNSNNVRVTVPLDFTLGSSNTTVTVTLSGAATLKQYTVTGVYNTDEANTTGSSKYNFGFSGSGDYFVNSIVNGLSTDTTPVLSESNSLITAGDSSATSNAMAVIGSGVPKGTTSVAISSENLTLSVAATIPNDTLLKFGKKIIDETFTASSGFEFDKEPTLDVIQEDENDISEYAFSTNWTQIISEGTAQSTKVINVSSSTVSGDISDIAVGMVVTGDGITSYTKVTNVSGSFITVDEDFEIVQGGVTYTFNPTVVITKVFYVFSTNNPTTDRLLITARANKAFLDSPNEITGLEMSTKPIPKIGTGKNPRSIKVIGREGAKFKLIFFTTATVSGAVNNSTSVTLSSVNDILNQFMPVKLSGVDIGRVETISGTSLTMNKNVTIPDGATLTFFQEHNQINFTNIANSPNNSTVLTMPANGVREFFVDYPETNTDKTFNYEVESVLPTSLSSSFIGDNPVSVSQNVDVTLSISSTEDFETADANLGNTQTLSILENASKSDQTTELDFAFAIVAESNRTLREIRKPSKNDFKYSTIIKNIKRLVSGTDTATGGCTAIIEFEGDTSEQALVTGSGSSAAASSRGMKVETRKETNNLPAGVYLKSLEPIANSNQLTIAHDSKTIAELHPFLKSGDKLFFINPLGYEFSFVSLNGTMTDSSGDVLVTKAKATATATTTGRSIVVKLLTPNDEIKVGATIFGGGLTGIGTGADGIRLVDSVSALNSDGNQTVTFTASDGDTGSDANANINKGSVLTFMQTQGQTYTVSGKVNINKFGNSDLSSNFSFNDFVNVIDNSGDIKKNFEKQEVTFSIDDDSQSHRNDNFNRRHIGSSIKGRSGFNGGKYYIYGGRGRDDNNDGIPEATSTDANDRLTPSGTEFTFTVALIFGPEMDYFGGSYSIIAEEQNNGAFFDTFSAGNEGGSAGRYSGSDITQTHGQEPNHNQNVFEWTFTCETTKEITAGDRPNINFKITMGRVSGEGGHNPVNTFDSSTNQIITGGTSFVNLETGEELENIPGKPRFK